MGRCVSMHAYFKILRTYEWLCEFEVTITRKNDGCDLLFISSFEVLVDSW